MAQKGKQKKSPAKQQRTRKGKAQNKKQFHFPFGRENYILMAAGFLIIIIGFILMSGSENIFSFRKITLSVIFIMSGYALEIYAILKKPKSGNKDELKEK